MDGYLALCDKGMANASNTMTEETVPALLNGKFHYKIMLLMLAKMLPRQGQQTTLAEFVNNSKGAIAKWITTDCRPINIVQDRGPQDIIQSF